MRNLVYAALISFLSACGSNASRNNVITVPPTSEADTTAFFPVREFLLGQVSEIKASPVNPMFIRKAGEQSDTTWLQHQSLDSAFSPFLFPNGDAKVLQTRYTQARFYDQSLPAVTLTYDLKAGQPALDGVRAWTIYINPKTEAVDRIFILRDGKGQSTEQITWLTGKYARMVTIASTGTQNTREDIVQWDLEESL